MADSWPFLSASVASLGRPLGALGGLGFCLGGFSCCGGACGCRGSCGSGCRSRRACRCGGAGGGSAGVAAAGCEAEGASNGQGQNSNRLLHCSFSFLYAPLCNGAVRSVVDLYSGMPGVRLHASTATWKLPEMVCRFSSPATFAGLLSSTGLLSAAWKTQNAPHASRIDAHGASS